MQREVHNTDISAQSNGRPLFIISYSLCRKQATQSPKILSDINIRESANHVL